MGIRRLDPDEDGPSTPYWTGTAVLKIESETPASVLFWTEETAFRLDDGRRRGQGPGDVPDKQAAAWTAVVSTTAGQKGYFSGSQIHGQFNASSAGTTPSGAIGHFQSGGQTGTFEVSK